jgi:hypothetical protein
MGYPLLCLLRWRDEGEGLHDGALFIGDRRPIERHQRMWTGEHGPLIATPRSPVVSCLAPNDLAYGLVLRLSLLLCARPSGELAAIRCLPEPLPDATVAVAFRLTICLVCPS